MKRLVLFMSLVLLSCQGPLETNVTPQSLEANANTVSIDEALRIAIKQAPFEVGRNGRLATRNKVLSTFEVNTEGKEASMFVINYENNGFIIIAGDNRISPILAHSESSSFPTDRSNIPSGLLNWLSAVDQTIKIIRSSKLKQDPQLTRLWEKCNTNNIIDSRSNSSSRVESATYTYIGDCNNGDPSVTLYTEAPELLSTKWDQGAGYNDLITYAGCSSTGNGRYWAGCVATAMAQVMRFHQYPNSYSWGAMPNIGGSYATSTLMRDIGSSVGMSYGCDASGAYSSSIPGAFNSYGYPTPSYSSNNYNYFTAKYDILADKPVILGGYKSSYWWIFGAVGGHSWVADGVKEWMYYSCSPDPNTPGEWISVYTGYDALLHMNWGWSGTYNGWYSAFNFNPGSVTYNYRPDMVTNIHKP